MFRTSIALFPNNEIRIREVLAVSSKAKGLTEKNLVLPSTLTLAPDLKLPPEVLSKPESLQLKPGYGGLPRKKNFTSRAKRRLLRVGGLIDKSGFQSSFLTGTLPGSTTEAMEAIARWSGYLSHRLKQWIYKVAGDLPGFGWFYCWEWQKRGALHIHFVVTFEGKKHHDYIQREFRAWWYRALLRVSELAGVDLASRGRGLSWRDRPSVWQCDAETVKKSVAAYLSKYLGKGSGEHSPEQSGPYYPSSWWGLSRGLLERLRHSLVSWSELSATNSGSERISELLGILGDSIVKVYRYNDRYGSGRNVVVYVKPGAYSVAKQLIESLPSSTSMDIRWSTIFLQKFMPQTEYLSKIWATTRDRTEFFESLSETCQDMVYAWANSRLGKNWISLIEQQAERWWHEVKLGIQANEFTSQGRQSEACLDSQQELGLIPFPGCNPGGMPSGERLSVPEGMDF